MRSVTLAAVLQVLGLVAISGGAAAVDLRAGVVVGGIAALWAGLEIERAS